MNKSILLTDAQQRKTLAAIRSLGRKGVAVSAGEETRFATSLFSRFCGRALVYPSPRKRPDEFYRWLERELQEHPCDVLFPMDDIVMEIVVRYRDQLEKLCRLPIPPSESYYTAGDKGLATAAAIKAGLNCPATVMPKSLEELPHLTRGLSFPVVIKPRKSSGSRGIVIVDSREDFAGQYHRVHGTYPWPIVQEFIQPGERFDVCLLFNRENRLKAAFTQREIRHFPLDNGPSTVQESVHRPDLVDLAARLVQEIGWYGVAEVEFMIDGRDGRAVFMEINPRFWASLEMAITAGVDFPWLLYRMAMDGDVEDAFDYMPGFKCRWLLPGDILHFLYNHSRSRMDPPFFSTSRSGLHDDILSMEDPLPAAGFILAALRYSVDPGMWRFMFRR